VGETFFEANVRAIVAASLVNSPFGGCVESVFTVATHRLFGSEQESVKVLILGGFLQCRFLVLKAVGETRNPDKDAADPRDFAVEMWKAAQNAASHIPTATAATAG